MLLLCIKRQSSSLTLKRRIYKIAGNFNYLNRKVIEKLH